MNCAECGKEFEPVRAKQKYCSQKCGHRGRYKENSRGTDYQYSLASGSWEQYYTRRLSEKGRRKTLSLSEILALHEAQGGLCALTNVPMTCILQRGVRTPTNASIDRIDAKGAYIISNIQLVCVAVNRLRTDMTKEEFINWCGLVTAHAGGSNE